MLIPESFSTSQWRKLYFTKVGEIKTTNDKQCRPNLVYKKGNTIHGYLHQPNLSWLSAATQANLGIRKEILIIKGKHEINFLGGRSILSLLLGLELNILHRLLKRKQQKIIIIIPHNSLRTRVHAKVIQNLLYQPSRTTSGICCILNCVKEFLPNKLGNTFQIMFIFVFNY